MPKIGEAVSLKRNGDFSRAYRSKKTDMHPLAVVYVRRNKLGCKRVGITTSKKIGVAVKRNRAKRVIRAALAAIEPEILPGWDIVVVARTKTTFVKSTVLEPVLRTQLTKLGVIKKSEESPNAEGGNAAGEPQKEQ